MTARGAVSSSPTSPRVSFASSFRFTSSAAFLLSPTHLALRWPWWLMNTYHLPPFWRTLTPIQRSPHAKCQRCVHNALCALSRGGASSCRSRTLHPWRGLRDVRHFRLLRYWHRLA